MRLETYENQPSLLRVLVIDPEEEVIQFIRRGICLLDYQVEVCQSGRQGIEIAMRTQPDLMIVELVLPDIDGLALLQRLRAEEIMDDRPIIVLTSLDDTQLRLQANGAGASAFMTKPFDILELLELVKLLTKPGIPQSPFLREYRHFAAFSFWRTGSRLNQPYHGFSKCPHCRAEVRFGDNFCLSCGNPIRSGDNS